MSRFLQVATLTVLIAFVATFVLGSPVAKNSLVVRQDVQNIVYIKDANTFW